MALRITTVITDVKNHGPLHARCPEAMVVGFEETVLTTDVVRASGGYFNWSRFRLRCYCTTNIKDGIRPTSKTTMVNYRWLSNYPVSQGNFSLTYPEKVVFTPHQMEWQRLSHLPIEQQTLVNNQRQQAKLGSTIVLKSHRTTIFHAENLFKIQVATLGWLLAELGIPWLASLLVF